MSGITTSTAWPVVGNAGLALENVSIHVNILYDPSHEEGRQVQSFIPLDMGLVSMPVWKGQSLILMNLGRMPR